MGIFLEFELVWIGNGIRREAPECFFCVGRGPVASWICWICLYPIGCNDWKMLFVQIALNCLSCMFLGSWAREWNPDEYNRFRCGSWVPVNFWISVFLMICHTNFEERFWFYLVVWSPSLCVFSIEFAKKQRYISSCSPYSFSDNSSSLRSCLMVPWGPSLRIWQIVMTMLNLD